MIYYYTNHDIIIIVIHKYCLRYRRNYDYFLILNIYFNITASIYHIYLARNRYICEVMRFNVVGNFGYNNC